jgi:hypothetical protein
MGRFQAFFIFYYFNPQTTEWLHRINKKTAQQRKQDRKDKV